MHSILIVLADNVSVHKLLPFSALMLNVSCLDSVEPSVGSAVSQHLLSVFFYQLKDEIKDFLKKEKLDVRRSFYVISFFYSCQDPYSRYIFRGTKGYIIEKPKKDLMKWLKKSTRGSYEESNLLQKLFRKNND